MTWRHGILSRGWSRIFLRRCCTTKEWRNWMVTWRAKLPFLRPLTYLHQRRFLFYVKILYTTDYLQNISCIWKPQVISGGHWTLLLDPPLLRPRRKHWQSFERARVSVCTCRTLNPNFTWSLAMHWSQYTQAFKAVRTNRAMDPEATTLTVQREVLARIPKHCDSLSHLLQEERY